MPPEALAEFLDFTLAEIILLKEGEIHVVSRPVECARCEGITIRDPHGARPAAIPEGVTRHSDAGIKKSLAVTYSPTVKTAVPSALKGLTAVFGMGTGVSPSL
jgi:hypothetical protein